MRRLLGWLLLGGLALGTLPALAAPPAPADRAANEDRELTRLRREVAGQVQLSAANLLDELVYGWAQQPPFETPTPVFLAGLTVPVGLGTGLAGLLENHLGALLLANPSSRVVLSACPVCQAMLVHSGPKGTVVSRGADNPQALEKLGAGGARHALYIDFAAEGAWLVLRARITKVDPDLPIVWSRTLPVAVGAPSLLRSPQHLKSPADARQEYLAALQNRGFISIPVRFAVRAYAQNDQDIASAPSVWLQTGIEAALTNARKWKASGVIGYAWLPDAYYGLMAETRFGRLISGTGRSLTGPDVYLILGGALVWLEGPAMAQLSNFAADQPRSVYGAVHLGLELRVGERVGAAVFFENMPTFDEDQVGSWVNFGPFDLSALGIEVSLCF
ncbi:MAG: hypothetical protein KC613_19570 [Myxococcales bacterium]|nr:hypothetical protein [Myxococcales bacterium]MCB9521799.1 hypothetical protein [Myxococcales bacterium]